MKLFTKQPMQCHIVPTYHVYTCMKLSGPFLSTHSHKHVCVQVLLVQGHERTTWGFPKGKMEDGENPMQCAIREVAMTNIPQLEDPTPVSYLLYNNSVAMFR